MNIKTIVNFLTLVIIMLGGLFKSKHWEGANILLLIGTLLLIVTIVFVVKEIKQEGNPPLISYLVAITLVLHLLGTLFKSMHWEGGAILVLLVYIFTVISAIVFILNKTELKLPKQFAITIFLYLILIMNLLMKVTEVVTAG